MDYKKGFLVLCLIICVLFTVSSVVASDLNDTVIIGEDDSQMELAQDENQIVEQEDNEEIISETDNGTFQALQEKIRNADSGATITLENNYAYEDGFNTSGIEISKPITIDGKNYVIDAKSKSRIFNITSNNVILKNIVFMAGSGKGSAIFVESNDDLQINSCSFINCSLDYGVAIYSDNNGVTINQSTFNNCGSCVYFFADSGDSNVISSVFTNIKDGAIYSMSDSFLVESCNFTNCYIDGTSGSAIVCLGEFSNIIRSCNFVDCFSKDYSTTDKAAIFDGSIDGAKIEDCTFRDTVVPTVISSSAVKTVYNVNKKLVITLKDRFGKAISGVLISINFNGAKKAKTDKNGQVKLSTNGLAPKTYTAKISFAGNADYRPSSKNVKVTVKKANPKLTAKSKAFKKSVKTKKYSVVLKTNKNKALSKVKVTLKIKGKKAITVKTNSKGKAVFKITKFNKKGTFKSTVTFKGNKYYNKVTKKVNIKIK